MSKYGRLADLKETQAEMTTKVLSIIVPTVFRSEEFGRFLASLISQVSEANRNEIELIVVDQNDDDRISRYLNTPPKIETKHLRERKISLSYAKNRGLAAASGTHCVFLDDDCWLSPDALGKILVFLNSNPLQGLLLKAVTPEGKFLVPSALVDGFTLTRKNVTESFFAPQIAQIYPTQSVKKLGGFNEKLGIGTPHGSAEDTDLLVRTVLAGTEFSYLPIVVFHPEVDYTSMTPEKSYQYGLGFGAFCRIHGWHAYWIYKMIRSLGGAILSLAKDSKQARSYFKTLQGRWTGYWSEL